MEILKNYFKNSQFINQEVILDEKELNQIKKDYLSFSKLKPANSVLEKPYGIFALADTCIEDYRIITFHYVDFRWYPISSGAKIMHKSNIEEWQDNKGFSCKFSESPQRFSGDVLGMMRGDFRDCFNEIIKQEKKRQIGFEGTTNISIDDRIRKVQFQSGIGLENLTMIEKISEENNNYVDLIFIN